MMIRLIVFVLGVSFRIFLLYSFVCRALWIFMEKMWAFKGDLFQIQNGLLSFRKRFCDLILYGGYYIVSFKCLWDGSNWHRDYVNDCGSIDILTTYFP